jgi:phage gpG-like protein
MAKNRLGGRAIRDKVRKLKKDIPQGTATLAVGWFQDSFRKQGFTDTGFKRWEKRKRVDRRRPGRAILVDTGRLRRSIRKERVTFRQVRIVSKLPYSARHNDGLKGMPQRKFMGESQKLERKMLKFIYKSIDKALGF